MPHKFELQNLLAGQRRALAKAITLVESRREVDRAEAQAGPRRRRRLCGGGRYHGI